MIIYGHPEGEHVVAFIPKPLAVVGPEDGDVVPPVVDPILDDDEVIIIPVVQVEHIDDDLDIDIDFDIAILEVAQPEATTIEISSSAPASPLTLSLIHSPDTVLPPHPEALPFHVDPILPTTFPAYHPIFPPVVGPSHYTLSGTSMPVEHLPPYPFDGSFATTVSSTVNSYYDPYAIGPSHIAPSYPMMGCSLHTSFPMDGDLYHNTTSMHSTITYPSLYFSNSHTRPPPGMGPFDPYHPSQLSPSTTEFRLTSAEIQLGIVFSRLHELSAQLSVSRAARNAAPSSSTLPPLPTSSTPPPLPISPPPPSPLAPSFPSHHSTPPSLERRISAIEEEMAFFQGVIGASSPPPPPPL
ncbi:hypothetical protein Hanom_Chr15g01407541 [Helianthus anomalus]